MLLHIRANQKDAQYVYNISKDKRLEFIFACIRPGVYLWLHQVWSLSLLASGLEFIFGCIRQ
jgi:hypothetical protein